jgi:pimeloyl-ACP methyl ester carboxylesterase
MSECPNHVHLSFRENENVFPSDTDTAESFFPLSPSTKLKLELPPTLFLHGLDSSSHTWRHNLDELGSRAVALDLRGCGNSPLGDPEDFTPDAIVEDIHTFLSSHPYFMNSIRRSQSRNQEEDMNIIPFVIVGHSMGGRIAMSYAARYPSNVKALVIEDMDVRTRPMAMNVFQSVTGDREATVNFDRCLRFDSLNENASEDADADDDSNAGNDAHTNAIMDIFEKEGYPRQSVTKWLKEGRLERMEVEGQDKDGSCHYYSHVNPAFRLLCYEQFFITCHGEDTWMDIVQQQQQQQEKSTRRRKFPIHVMVADKEKTVCDEEIIFCFMKDTMKEGGEGRLMVLHRYKGATHSIHNSARSDFLKDLRTIIRTAALD